MTNEQAKKMLKAKLECLKRETSGTDFDCNNRNCDECSLCYEQGNMGEQKEALDMAIKTLEQQPCEDTISRQAAIDAVKKNTFRLTFAEEQNCEGHVAWSAETVYSDVMEGALLDLPSAQPERIRGRWIEKPHVHGVAYCSLCDYELHTNDTNFCPNCGAKMKVGENAD